MIIVNYQVPVFLEQCIITVKRAMQQLSGEIIVVDNASADNSIEYVNSLFPDVRFIRSDENIGFARANNLGLSCARGRYVLFLNPDTLVPENTLIHCVTFLQQHYSCGAVGVRMINGFGNYLPESKRARPTLINTVLKLTGAATLFPKSGFFNQYALGHLPVHEQHPVDVLAGAFMMVRKNILDELQGFDTDFFMYGEDIDLSIRIKQLGHQVFYLGDIAIIHYKGQSSSNRLQKQNRIFYKAMRLFVHKHYSVGWLFTPFIFLVQWMAAFRKWLFPSHSVLFILNRKETAFIVANMASYKQVLDLLKRRSQEGIIKGYISVTETHTIQTSQLKDLSVLCLQQQIKQLLICVPDLSLQEAIQIMQRQKGLFFRFVFSGSESLPF